jgi:hypothetical protein
MNLTVLAGSGKNSSRHQCWRTGGDILANGGGVVEVFDDPERLVRHLDYQGRTTRTSRRSRQPSAWASERFQRR